MSELHIRQIKAALESTFSSLIDMSDYDHKNTSEQENAFLSRALGVFALTYLTGESPGELAACVTDGGQDNGIDAIYYHATERVLYLAQSKWRQSGAGSISRGDTQKFLKGFRDLINARWLRFNTKVQAMAPVLESALNDATTRIVLIVVYTGQEPLASEVQRDIQDALDEINDPTELVTYQVHRQVDVYSAVAQGIEGSPIDVDLALYDWGQVREPYLAYYGQVAASDLASWYQTHQTRLFAPNIRMFLGPTEVNGNIVETLTSSPKNFWYFNNGITALCRTIGKKPLGGSSRETGIFECRDLRVVNGAQTVGAIAAAAERDESAVAGARVAIRVVALEACPPDFDRLVTRYNNTQNRIDRRDFVALDPQQERLRGELQLEGVQYAYKSGDTVASTTLGFDLTEATVARACRQSDGGLAVQAKREIGRLWDDLERPPYKILFNGALVGPSLWRQVLIVRTVEDALNPQRGEQEGRRRLLAVHGNRFITHLVMERLDPDVVDGSGQLSQTQSARTEQLAKAVFEAVHSYVDQEFPDAYLASFFKNASKCKLLKSNYASHLDGTLE